MRSQSIISHMPTARSISNQICISLFVFTLLLFQSCSSQDQDYSELKYVYTDMANTLKTMDEDAVKQLCDRLAPDEKTLDFMRENDICYRGIPCQMDAQGYERTYIGEQYFPKLKRILSRLYSEGVLENLEHIDSTDYKWDNEEINGISIKGTETHARFKSGNKTISYLMGEMIYINGRWSLFTTPNVDLSIREE